MTLHGRGQNHHIKFIPLQTLCDIGMGNHNPSEFFADLHRIRSQHAEKLSTIFRQNLPVERLGVLSRKAQFGMKLTNSGFRQLQSGLVCMLQGIKTTNPGTVFIEFFRSRPHTMHKSDVPGRSTVLQQNFPFRGTV